METRNLFADLPPDPRNEHFEPLLEESGFLLERIVSRGQATPAGEWLDQARHEWVVLLSGSAALRFEGEAEERVLEPGDHLLIPAGCRHRVDWTDPAKPTVWLALHYEGAR